MGGDTNSTVVVDGPKPVSLASNPNDDEIEIVVQVNGRVRTHFSIAKNATREELEAHARTLVSESPKKVIVVPGKLVNIVA